MPPSQRLLSLDVMRGGTILGMLLVNNPGSWSSLYWPLGHAEWHGWTLTDLVFPFFLFMVGVAMAYSFAKYKSGERQLSSAVWVRIARRVVLLILLGLLLGLSGQIWQLLLGKSGSIELATLRWPGVLQRIGLAYLGASILVLLLGLRGQVIAGGILLLGYGTMLFTLPTGVTLEERLGQESNIVRAVDVAIIGKQHMWTQSTSRPTDPEGLLSTLPAIVTALLGYWTGLFLRHTGPSMPSAWRLIAAGGAVALVGQLLGAFLQPINKALWTPTFVLLAGGLAAVTLGLCLLIFDRPGGRPPLVTHIGGAFEAVGVNAIFAFVASGLFARLLTVATIGESTVKSWVYEHWITSPLAGQGITSEQFASLMYAVVFVTFWWLLLIGMRRIGWTMRV